MSQPVARVLDFSNVGVPEPSVRDVLDVIQFEPNDTNLPEQSSTRARTEAEFAVGAGPYAQRAYGRQRRALIQPQLESEHRIAITVSRSHNRCLIRKKAEVGFNPMTFEEFYAKPCPPGCTRIFKEFLTMWPLPLTTQAQLLVSLPFSQLSLHVNKVAWNHFTTAFHKNHSPGFKFELERSLIDRRLMVEGLWDKFVVVRRHLLRLVNAFILRKTKKKMILVPNYITMEDPSPSNCIEWTDVDSRCSYRIHGETLLKSLTMYLHHSEYGFPHPLWPKNPSTNAPFSHYQIDHIIYELYAWCGKNRKPVPYILTKFQEAKYCLNTLIVKNRPELTLYACQELFTEIHQPDAVEMWLDMVEEFASLYSGMTRDELETEIPRWILSLESQKESTKKKNALELIKKWKNILPDLVQYSRFKYFNRSDWGDINALKKMIKTLWATTNFHVGKYAAARKEAMLLAVQTALGSPESADDSNSDDTHEEDAAPEHASEASSELSLTITPNVLTNFLSTYNIPLESNFYVLYHDGSEANDIEYNMARLISMMPQLSIPPIPPTLPLADLPPTDAAPVNPADSFDTVE